MEDTNISTNRQRRIGYPWICVEASLYVMVILDLSKKTLDRLRACLSLILLLVPLSMCLGAGEPHLFWERTYGGTDYDLAYSVIECRDGGYLVAGWTECFGSVEGDLFLIRTDDYGQKVWHRTYGGDAYDSAYSVVESSEGGFLVVGWTKSRGAGNADVYLVRIDDGGNIIWERTYGGAQDDRAFCVIEASDGGYMVAGYTESFGLGTGDVYLLKVGKNGEKVWEQAYGSNYMDLAYSIVEGEDGGYVLAGYTLSQVSGADVYLLKVDGEGNKVWEKRYGGSRYDSANCIIRGRDGGFLVAGWTESLGAGGADAYLMKIDDRGEIIWERAYGNTSDDRARSVVESWEGGYLVVGWTESFGAEARDVYVFQIDVSGNMIWERTYGISYGSARIDDGRGVLASGDRAYVVAANTQPVGFGASQIYLLKIETWGRKVWEKTYEAGSRASCMIASGDGGYIIAGETEPPGSVRADDVYVLKIDRNGDKVWEKTYGTDNIEGANWIVRSPDGGYVVAGYTRVAHESWSIYLVKIGNRGERIWERTYPGNDSYSYSATCIIRSEQGGYLVVASKWHSGIHYTYLFKIDEEGDKVWERDFGGTYTHWPGWAVQIGEGGYVYAFVDKQDLCLSKMDGEGGIVWEKRYKGTHLSSCVWIVESGDGGFIVAGGNWSRVDSLDFYALKIDAQGNRLWERSFGGRDMDSARCIISTNDGGYVMAGSTSSFCTGKRGAYIVKMDQEGDKIWEKTLGEDKYQGVSGIVEAEDGMYVLAGSMTSSFPGIHLLKFHVSSWQLPPILIIFSLLIWRRMRP